MKLPALDQPARYQGLYVFDFGGWCAVGYTAEEIAMLLESEKYRDGKVYRIHRASPDGRMELAGVSNDRFQLESGMFFYRASENAARLDFEDLCRKADDAPPPCKSFVHLADRGGAAGAARYVVALIYGAEHDQDVGAWLNAIEFEGGDVVEGGVSHVTNYYDERCAILERRQLWTRSSIPSRSADEVFASVRRAVQR
ncbi:MAG: hypothetical protein HRF50_04120 [Phycisphaerae bacterium]|jgi:hypothetical protein